MKEKQSGFALILSLVLLLVMSLMGGALIVIVSGDHKKKQWQRQIYANLLCG